MATTTPTPATNEIDPSLAKVNKTIDGLKGKLDKQAEQIADLKKQNAELKSNGSRIKRIPKAKGGKGVKEVPAAPAGSADIPNAVPPLSTPPS